METTPTICDVCLKLPTQTEMLTCTHGTNSLPRWKSEERHKRLKCITMVSEPAVTRGLRENTGIITSDDNIVVDTTSITTATTTALNASYAFDKGDIDRLISSETRPYCDTIHSPDRIYVTVDPDGGGLSKMSIASGYLVMTNPVIPTYTLVIIRLDSERTGNHRQQEDMLTQHISHIRKQKKFQNVSIIFVLENQTGFFHVRMENYIDKIPNAKIFFQNGGAKAGIKSSRNLKNKYIKCTEIMLSTNAIKWEISMVEILHRESILNELKDELMSYHCIGNTQPSAKTGMKIYNETRLINSIFLDNISMAFITLCYWSKKNTKYGTIH